MSELNEAAKLIGQRRIWYPYRRENEPVIVEVDHVKGRAYVSKNEQTICLNQVWCTYRDIYGKEQSVWFSADCFIGMPIAEGSRPCP